MEKEPKELQEAKSRLAEYEKLENDPKGIERLTDALAFIRNLIGEDYPQTYKEVGKNLITTYGKKTLERLQGILSDSVLRVESLEYTYKAFKAFYESGYFINNQEFTLYKNEVIKKLEDLTENDTYSNEEMVKALKLWSAITNGKI